MSTTYYNLPEISGSTVANGVDAINGLATATDAALHAVAATIPGSADISALETAVETANTNANAALNTATLANSTAAQANTTAGAAVSTANGAQSAAATNAAAITALQGRATALEAMFNFNVNHTGVSPTRTGIFNTSTMTYLGTGASGATYSATGVNINVATNSTGSYAKIYGTYRGTRSGTMAANESVVIGISLTSIGLATPSESFAIAAAGLAFYKESMTNLAYTHMYVCSDGYLYLEGASSVASAEVAIVFVPCIYQIADFGD